ncbi:hypothetical protein NQ314_012032 [Rhamnusium bicolor]|uniref:DUF5641 domain-containing protein n=1 Tax=Rhamnusium bicolor TaxID=1586634 RepID=A0AAV8XEX0_9CUCU|nr:hypothetical protein NQ314_012032 [Rhamnusium bicolor]
MYPKKEQFAKFWALEEPPSLVSNWSEEDKKYSPSKLGDSREYALQRFWALEKRLAKNPKLKKIDTDCMMEYETMGHMSRVLPSSRDQVSYFLPHHGVLNEKSLTTKLRLVFNGLASTDTKVSFIDIQGKGPNVPDELLSSYDFVSTMWLFVHILPKLDAILNSGPVLPLSSSLDDMDALTTALFLIGKRLTSLPDPDLRDVATNCLSKFQQIQLLSQHFWSRWSKEYVTELQQRKKLQKE